jgi:predicted DNA-binding protein
VANFTKKTSSIILPPAVEKKINEIADIYFIATKKKIVITDGTRTAAAQAVQVFNKILANDLTIYLNHKAANEIKAAFDLAKSAGKPKAKILEAMEEVIESQIERKIFISRHLTGRAFDVRSNNLTLKEHNLFKQAAQSAGGVTVLVEGKPPHFHIQLT